VRELIKVWEIIEAHDKPTEHYLLIIIRMVVVCACAENLPLKSQFNDRPWFFFSLHILFCPLHADWGFFFSFLFLIDVSCSCS
jgi:hypothetical protein